MLTYFHTRKDVRILYVSRQRVCMVGKHRAVVVCVCVVCITACVCVSCN